MTKSITDTTELLWLCSGCGTKIKESEFHSLHGNFACEQCVRNSYANYPLATVELEVKERRARAIEAVKRERKAIEKQQT
jgi:recombinational DNA repair protein (RecF pathway)